MLSHRASTASAARAGVRASASYASPSSGSRPGGGAGRDVLFSPPATAPARGFPTSTPSDLPRPSGAGGRALFFGEGSSTGPTFYASSSSSSSSSPSDARPGGRTSRQASFDLPAPSSPLGADPALLSRPGGRASRSADFDDALPSSSPPGADPALATRPGGRAGRDDAALAGGGGGGGGGGVGGGGGGDGGGGGGQQGEGDGEERWSKRTLATGGVAYLGVCVGALAINEALGKKKSKAPSKGACCAGKK
jgi:hypothetical protein